MSEVLGRGFIFWGLFVASAATMVGYWLWMRAVESED